LCLVGFELLHFASQLGELLSQMCGLRSESLRRLLQVGSVELRQITRDALLHSAKRDEQYITNGSIDGVSVGTAGVQARLFTRLTVPRRCHPSAYPLGISGHDNHRAY